MTSYAEQIAEAERRVAICLSRAEKPGASIEDELSLQCARNWLLTLEKKVLLHALKSRKPVAPTPSPKAPQTAREKAEAVFDTLTKEAS